MKVIQEVGRLIIEWIIKNRGTGYAQRIISTPLGKAICKGIERMDYPRWYHITSSPTKSFCRHVVGDRLKRSGMRWIEEGTFYATSPRLKWKNNE